MKSYDEVTNNLLERRDRYVAEQKHKRKKEKFRFIIFC
mgnify:CR=1 FL=1